MDIKWIPASRNPCYTAGKKIEVKGLMLHSVGVPQPKASVFFSSWNKETAKVCTHAVLQEDGTVLQLLPWDCRAWHCGSGSKGSGNNTHIGIEMTEPETIRYTGGSSFSDTNPTATKAFVAKTYKVAVELFAYLCGKYGLDPEKEGTVISHSEAYTKGIASNHGDVEHIWKKYGLTMAGFRADVKAVMAGTGTATPQARPDTAAGYTIKITAGTLNVRKGPGTNYAVVTKVKKNEVYTVVAEEKNGSTTWGKLKSGVGYISMAYTERC